jgi:hypothetical protein
MSLPAIPGPVAGPAQIARHGGVLPVAPVSSPAAPRPLATRVEWAGAVRPADATAPPDPPMLAPLARPRPDPDLPTGPPPAFAANLLDTLPDSLYPADADVDQAEAALPDRAPPPAAPATGGAEAAKPPGTPVPVAAEAPAAPQVSLFI